MKTVRHTDSILRLALIVCAAVIVHLPTAQAQVNVHIEGTSDGAAGKRIGLYVYDDMLTMGEHLADEAVIGADGRFSLACYANYPRLVYVQAENYSQSFYVEPGRRYEVYLPQFDWSIDEQKNVFLDPEPLPLEFLHLPANELNLAIDRFERVVDSFVVANRTYFDPKFKPQKRWFDSLRAEVKRRLPAAAPESFLGRYEEYTLAEMQLAMHFISRKKLIARYIDGQPVRYHDEQYMRLLLALYEGSISNGSNRLPLHRLTAWVERGDLATYIDSLGVDPLLRNEQIRELAALQALKESYYNPAYNRDKVRRMVEALGRQSKFKEHRQLAERLTASLKAHERGSEAPQFILPDVDRQPVNLDDLRGKWVYLSFVRVGDPHSLSEIETLAYFRDSIYARCKDVVFVSISCDREFQKMYHFLRNSKRGHRYNWTWLHFDGNYKLLEHYGVVSYPTFVLIGPDGRLQYDITPPPASGFLLRGPWEKKESTQKDDNLPFWQR